MPVFLHLANLVFDKNSIEKKYNGGCVQFRTDWNLANSKANQEDDELFLIAAMNIHDFNILEFKKRGIDFNNEINYSKHFVAISRYGNALWKTDWFKHNGTFAWHSNCNQEQKDRAIEIGEVMTMDKIQELAENGINVFETIKTATDKG